LRIWLTEIKAICPVDGRLKTFGGPHIEAPSLKLAQEYCQSNGLGYCRVIGELIDDENDYEKIQSN